MLGVLLRDERPHLHAVLEPRTEPERFRDPANLLEERDAEALVHDQAGRCPAHLTGVPEDPVADRFRGAIDIRIAQDDHRTLSAQLHRGRNKAARGELRDPNPDLAAPGERDGTASGVVDERFADFPAAPASGR